MNLIEIEIIRIFEGNKHGDMEYSGKLSPGLVPIVVGNPCFSWCFQPLGSSGCLLSWHFTGFSKPTTQTPAPIGGLAQSWSYSHTWACKYLELSILFISIYNIYAIQPIYIYLSLLFDLTWSDISVLSLLPMQRSNVSYSYPSYPTYLQSTVTYLILSYRFSSNPFYSIYQSPTYSHHVSSFFPNVD